MFKSDKQFHQQQQQQQKKKKGGDKMVYKDPSSSSSISNSGGGAFVVKRPAHLRSAVAKRESNKGSPSVERLAATSPIRVLPSNIAALNAASSSNHFTDGQQNAHQQLPPSSHTLVAVFPSLQEFVQEREILRGVLIDLQQYFCELDLDFECCYLFETVGDILNCIDEYLLLNEILCRPNSSALIFIGDRYGDELLPLELSTDEFNALKEAALEMADDAGILLEQFYQLDRTNDPLVPRYQLMANKDPEGARRLCTGIKKCARRAFDDLTVAQLEKPTDRKVPHYTKSFIELCANAALANPRSLIVTRRFKDPSPSIGTEKLMDPVGSKAYDRLNEYKNELSARLGSERDLAFLLDLKGGDLNKFNQSKEAILYANDLATKLTEKLKGIVVGTHPNLELNAKYPTAISSGADHQIHIAQVEERIHMDHLSSRMPAKWIPRDRLDGQLDSILQRILGGTKAGNGSSSGHYIQIHGPPGSGKTATLCRLFQLVEQNMATKQDGEEKAILSIRFTHLTDGTVFANEMLRNCFLAICERIHDEGSTQSFLHSFHLSSVLGSAKSFLDRQNAQHVVLFLDDVHLLKFGRTLGRNQTNLRKLFPNFSIICTSNSTQPIPGFPHTPELMEIKPPTVDQAISILNEAPSPSPNPEIYIANQNVRLSPDQIGQLRQMLQQKDVNLVVGAIQKNDILTGHSEISGSIEARLIKAEMRCGADNVRLFCEFLCCAPCGMTALELLDAFRLRNYTTGFMFEPQDVLSAMPLLILRHLQPLLDSIIVDQRRIYFFRSAQIAQAAQHRYLQSAGDVKLANETLAKIFMGVGEEEGPGGGGTGNEDSSMAMVFPRPILKEGGMRVDIRRIRYHWYYLLRTGDVEALKHETLCAFQYLEAIFRNLGLARLLSIFEECLQQILDHDLLCILEGILLPAIPTLVREPPQFVSEFLNRLRYTRAKNSNHLNRIVEQAMQWTDSFDASSLLVPLTCWISPPKMKQVLNFAMPQWKSSRSTILQPTHNHQHLLVAGNELAPNCIYMFHIASQLLVRTFTVPGQTQVTSLCASKSREQRDIVAMGGGTTNHNQNHFFTSTTADGKIQVWSFTQTDQLKTLEAGSSRIICSILSSDDKWIAIGSADSCARILLLDSGQCTKLFKDHTGPVCGVQLTSDDALLVTGSGDFAVMIWDIEKEMIIVRLQGLMAPVTCLALTRNDAFLAVACEDETLRIFSLVSAQELHELIGHESRINALQASADDCKLFAGTRGKVLVYDIHNGQLLEILPFPLERQPITSVRISDDDSFVLAAAGDRVNIWAMNSINRDVAANQQKEQQQNNQQMIIDQQKQQQIGEEIDGNGTNANANNASQQPSTSVSCIQIAPDEKGAGCGTLDGIVAFWDLDICQCMWTSNQQKTGRVTALGFSVDSALLLSGSQNGSVSIWDTISGQMLKQIQLHTEFVSAICVFVDGMRVLSCDSADNAYLWSLISIDEGNNNRKVELIASISNMHPPLYVRLSDTVIIAQHASNPKEMNIWTLSGDRLFTRSKVHHNEPILCYAVNRSGTVLITGSKDMSLKVWQMDTGGLLIQVLVGHEDIPTCCCVSEDSHVAVSGARDRRLIIWDVQIGTIIRCLNRNSVPQFLEISLDGSVFCSSGDDGWLEAWHIRTGRLLSAFNTHRKIAQLIMGADGDRILVKLIGTAQLPIICLHNTPANLTTSSASRYERVQLVEDSSGANTSTTKLAIGGGLMLTEISRAESDEGPLGDKIGDGMGGGQMNEKEPVTSRVGEEEEDMKEQTKIAEKLTAKTTNGPDRPSNDGGGGNNNGTTAQMPQPMRSNSAGKGPSQKEDGQQQRARRSKLCTII